MLVLFISIFFTGLNNHSLWTPDEPRVAEIGREMAERGNFLIPELNKKPFLEHPPLYYASLAVVFKIAKKATDGLARIPSAIYGMAGALATFLMGYTLFGLNIGLFSAFIVSTSFEYLRVSHWVIVDSGLACFVFFAMWSYIRAYFSNEKERKSLFYILFYVFCILAFFVKGFIGIAIPAVTILSFLILDRNIRELARMHLWLGLLIFFMSLFLWALCLYHYGGMEYLKVFFLDNNLLRFLPGGTSGHQRPFYYYLTEFPAGFIPWSILIIPAFFYVFSKDISHDKKKILFLMCWFISGFILLSLSATKRILYMLPIFAPISIIIALFIEYVTESSHLKMIYKIFLWLYGGLYVIMGVSFLPTALYAIKTYEIDMENIKLVFTAFISLIVVTTGVLALTRLKKYKNNSFFYLTGLSLYIILVFALIYIPPEVDRYKSLKPFAVKVSESVPEHIPIYSYKPDETIRGFIPFYTGRYLIEVHERNDLKSIKKTVNTIYIAIRDKDNELKNQLMEEGFVEVLYFPMGMDRSLYLFKN
ncbi:MAG: glycosyltransferase family 39 protein [Syntrophorhabdaceae bacterium]|nr:glycosyltransferase family 39 protein [Syntrophorhabdaceae bacterium]